MIKTILTPLGGGQSDEPVLDTALTLARPLQAHIAALHCNVDPADAAAVTPPVSFLIGPALSAAMDQLTAREQRRSANALHTFNAFCEHQQVPMRAEPAPGLSASLDVVDGAPWDVLPGRARHHDLVVMGRKHAGDNLPESLAADVLVRGGQPCCWCPSTRTAACSTASCCAGRIRPAAPGLCAPLCRCCAAPGAWRW